MILIGGQRIGLAQPGAGDDPGQDGGIGRRLGRRVIEESDGEAGEQGSDDSTR